MAIDMRQFHQTFFEESLEGIAVMEAELLSIENIIAQDDGKKQYDIDKESLNTIFRVVHSIKGGSSTFGFGWVADFSHSLETLLDDLRDGRLGVNRKIVDILIHSVDALRNLLEGARTDKSLDDSLAMNISATLDELQLVREQDSESKASSTTSKQVAETSAGGWRISFKPHSNLFKSGNDPLRIFRELSTLGDYQVAAEITQLPNWKTFDPEASYLIWRLEVRGNIPKNLIDEAFDWVAEDCDLDIASIQPPQISQPQTRDIELQDKENTKGVTDNTTSIRVSTPKVDALVDIVGELVITQTMLMQLAGNFSADSLPQLESGLVQLERNTRELQDSVMSIRMLPIGFVFNRMPRLVRDVSQKLGKKIDLRIKGERTELDKTVIERISDPLMHLVRNCIDHGIETPEIRQKSGKPETGTILLDAYQMGGNVVVEIQDDGHGLQQDKILTKAMEKGHVSPDAKLTQEQIHEFIFLPGISTANSVSDVSGRGVGMDVVRSNIRSLGGGVGVVSHPNEGTKFTIHLPLTLAIVDGLSVEVGEQTYIMPLTSIVESIRISADDICQPAGGPELFALRKEYLPLIRIYDLFQIKPRHTDIAQGILVIVEAEGKKAGLFVDDLLGQQQVVIKTLEAHCQKIDGISAATILGNGGVALILDVTALIRLAHDRSRNQNMIDNGPMITANQSTPASDTSLRG